VIFSVAYLLRVACSLWLVDSPLPPLGKTPGWRWMVSAFRSSPAVRSVMAEGTHPRAW